jgi:hypothetical protein
LPEGKTVAVFGQPPKVSAPQLELAPAPKNLR